MKHVLIVTLCLLVAGCSTAIEMRNPVTGQTAKCGPYGTGLGTGGLYLADRERQCISDYQRQGFERAP